jgi:Flp pilus assembly protein protease CpaA
VSVLIFHSLLLCTMLLTGILVMREDMKTKRIPNKFLLTAAAIGLSLYLVALASNTIDPTHFFKVIMNTILSFAVSYAIWKFGLWPAGDAKFFITCSFLVPLPYYSQTYLRFFPSFALLLNVAIVYLIFFGLRLTTWAIGRVSYLKRRGFFNPKVFRRYLRAKSGSFLKKHKAIPRNARIMIYFKILIALVTFIFLQSRSVRGHSFLAYAIFFLSLRIIMQAYFKYSILRKIKISEISPGMNLSQESILQLKAEKDFFASIDTMRPEGLTNNQAHLIREHLVARNINSISIYQTFPFSFFIIIGTVVTIYVHGSFLYLISPWMQR